MGDGTPIRVLFVCTANICRSAYAERRAQELMRAALLRRSGGADPAPCPVTFHSAGVHGFEGHRMDAAMAAELSARGGDPHGFRSRPLHDAHVVEADLIVTAESPQRVVILDDHPQLVSRLFTMGQVHEALRKVDGSLSGRPLIRALGRARGPASAELDIHDPYRKGPEAARVCADAIDAHLEVLVPRLAGVAGTPT